MKMRKEKITPKKAAEYLKRKLPNRRTRPSLVVKYATDMKAGRWMLTHEGIAFDKRGRLIDGQHRLEAIIVAGVSIEMYVFSDLNRQTMRSVNIGGIRWDHDQLGMGVLRGGMTFQDNKKVARLAKTMLAGLKYKRCDVSNDMSFRCIEMYHEEITWLLRETDHMIGRAEANAVLVKAVIIHPDDRPTLKRFCHNVRAASQEFYWDEKKEQLAVLGPDGEPLRTKQRQYEPATMLLHYLHASRQRGNKRRSFSYRNVYGSTVSAIRYHLHGRMFKGQTLPVSSSDIGFEEMFFEFAPRMGGDASED
jgi:hypothetical protein